MRNLVVAVAVLAATASLSACGSAKPAHDDPFGTSSLSRCSDVWVVGKTLPKDYSGCMNGNTLVASVRHSDNIVWYQDRLVAKPGGIISKASVK
jgi:hypothetical protein